jgi:hypothetical protein
MGAKVPQATHTLEIIPSLRLVLFIWAAGFSSRDSRSRLKLNNKSVLDYKHASNARRLLIL